MAKAIKFELKGAKEVNKVLAQLPKKLSDKVILDINKGAGRIVQKELAEATPQGENTKGNSDKAFKNITVAKSNTKTGVLIGFRKKAWYIRLIEYGTKVRKLKGKGRYKRGTNRGVIKRKPFVEKAHQSAYPKAIEYFAENYLKIVNRTLKRLAKKYR